MAWSTKTIKINKNSNNGNPIQLPSATSNKGIQVKANKDNGDSIYIAPNLASFADGDSFPLDATDTILMDVANMSEIWVKTDSVNDVRLHLLPMNK